MPMKHYLKDKHVLSVMIEVNRRLYMDAPGRRSERFDEIRNMHGDCVRVIEDASMQFIW